MVPVNRRRVALALGCAALLLATCGAPTPAPAQDAPDQTAPAKPQGRGKKGTSPQARAKRAGDAWAEFLPQYMEQLSRDSQGAPALFGRFVGEHPDLPAYERVAATEDAARRLFERDAAQLDAALALLGTAKANATELPERLSVANAQAFLLRAGGRLAQSEALLQAVWPEALVSTLLNNQDRQDTLVQYVKTLSAQNKDAQAEALVWETLARYPMLLQIAEFRIMMERLFEHQNKREELLSWAKLDFMLMAFEEKNIASATQRLNQAWMGEELSVKAVREFARAQADVAAPNPLDAIALPQWPAPVQKALLEATQQNSLNTRVTALLALERPREAMLLAREALVRAPTSAVAVKRVALIFKAADGDVARANAFLAYYSSGQGENPLNAFLEQEPGQTPPPNQAPTAPAGDK